MECFSKRKWENGKNVKIRGNCTLSMTYFSKRKCENGRLRDCDNGKNVKVRSKLWKTSSHENVKMIQMLK